MKRSPLIYLLLLPALIVPAFASPFVSLKFDEACKAATKESKIVLIDFYTTWCGPCKMLDQKTWTDADVIKLLEAKTVPLKVDAEKNTELAGRYKIKAYPTILLLKPDGTEIDRLVGYCEPKAFITEFNAALSGKDAVARAKEKVNAAGANGPMTRMQLGKALAQKQQYAEALAEYLWCFDHGLEVDTAFTGVRVSFLLSDIMNLSHDYPAAREALETRRDEREAKLLEGASDRLTVQDLIRLNENLDQKEKNLTLFDRLPPESKSRSAMLESVVDQLLSAKRYADVLKGTDPEAIFNQQVRMLNQGLAPFPTDHPSRANIERIFRQRAVSTGVNYFEALAGTKQNEAAKALAEKILKFDNLPETRDRLSKSAMRAANAELGSYLKN